MKSIFSVAVALVVALPAGSAFATTVYSNMPALPGNNAPTSDATSHRYAKSFTSSVSNVTVTSITTWMQATTGIGGHTFTYEIHADNAGVPGTLLASGGGTASTNLTLVTTTIGAGAVLTTGTRYWVVFYGDWVGWDNVDTTAEPAPGIMYSGNSGSSWALATGGVGPQYKLTLQVDGVVNTAPVANNDSYSVNEDAPLAVAAAGVLSNDTDAENNTLTASLTTGPASGTLALNSNGGLTYTPVANFNGSRTFTYRAYDGALFSASSATVTITVNAVNDVPSFTKGGNITVNEDSGASTIAGWATAISTGPADEAGQTVSFTATADQPSLFSAQPAVSSNGTLTFTPAANAFGVATVSVTIKDNGGTANGGVDTSAVQTFTITINAINDAPSFTKGADVSVNEDSTAYSAGWATNITAGPGEASQTVTFTVTSNNTALFATQPAVSASGVLTFTPAANASGSATVSVTLKDNGGTANGGIDTSATQTFTLTVVEVNDAPSFTKGGNLTVLEDASAQTVAGWATNISMGPPSEAAQTGAFTVSNTNTGLFSTQPALSATGTLTFTPAANANGVATVTVTLKDNGGTLNGGVDTSAAQTFTITVTAVNDTPSFTKGSNQTVNEDSGASTVSGWATAISAGPNEGSQNVTFTLTNSNNALFATQPAVSAAGVLTYTPAANANGSATITVVLKDDGGTANGGVDTSAAQTFTITVNAVNDAPGFAKGADQTVSEDAPAQNITGWATSISAGPADESAQTLSFTTSSSNPALFSAQPAVSANGTLTYTTAADASGTATVTVTLKDTGGTANGGVDTSAAQTFTITVNSVNDAPSFTKGADVSVLEDSAAQTITGWATGISAGPANESGQTVAFTVIATPSSLFTSQPALSSNGTLTFALAANASGSASVSVTLQDNGGTANGGVDTSAAQTFTITVNDVNDAPSFIKGNDVSVNEDVGAQSLAAWATSISAGPVNEASQTLVFSVSADKTALFSTQPAVSDTGTLTFTPAPNANGSAVITLSLHDNGGTANGGIDTTASQTFTITINPVNDPPTFVKGADVSVAEDAALQTIAGWATSIAPGPSDEASQKVTFTVTASDTSLFSTQPAIASDGTLTYRPASNANGSATITVIASDTGGTSNGGLDTSAAQTFVITVRPVNDAPSFTKGADVTVNEDSGAQSVTGWATAISAGAANESDQTLTFTAVAADPSLFSTAPAVSAAGTLTYQTQANAFGSTTVTVTLSDNGGTSNGGIDSTSSQTFTVTVLPVNDPPTFTKGDDVTVSMGAGPQRFDNWAKDITPGPLNESQQLLLFSATTDNDSLFTTLPSISLDGGLTFTPKPSATGEANVEVTLSDNGGVANGGVDTTVAQFFKIIISAVTFDAGTADDAGVDGGGVEPGLDAGPVEPHDAGPVVVDAGHPTGGGSVDAGTGPDTAGGCGCSSGSGSTLGVLALGLMAMWSRRRRSAQ